MRTATRKEAPAPEHAADGGETVLPMVNPHVEKALGFLGPRTPMKIESVELVQQLTPPITAMIHQNQMLFEPDGEIYQMDLPVKGRSETMQPANVINGWNIETGEYTILICNVMMVSAFNRARQKGPLSKRSFAIKAGDLMSDKAYRIIDVIEISVKFSPPE